MPSVLQIVNYAKEHLNDLVQVDASKNDAKALACVPDIFVPISDCVIKPEDIKYICAKRMEQGDRVIYQIISLKDFESAGGILIKEGEFGGFVDVKTFLGHNDKSWIDNTSMVFSSKVTGESLIAGKSEIVGCSIKNSTIEDCEIKNAVRIDNSHLKEVLAEESCSITKSTIYDSILVDRAHFEKSKISGSSLTFCNVVDSKLKNEKVMGDASNLNMAKIYDYESQEEPIQPVKKASKFTNFWNSIIHNRVS